MSRACRQDPRVPRCFGAGDRLDRRSRRRHIEHRQLDRPAAHRAGTISTERLRFHARLMKPLSCRLVRCLWTVASDDRPNRRPISSRLGRSRAAG